MVGAIYRERKHGRERYKFWVEYGSSTRWQFMSVDYEHAVSRHERMVLIEEKVQSVFAYLQAQSEYVKFEPDIKILTEQIGGTWVADKLYDYFKILFLLSGSDGLDWFLNIVMRCLVLHKDCKYMKPPVIEKLEVQFASVERWLEQKEKWLELAYAQIARETGFRMNEMDFLEWEDIQYPKIRMRPLSFEIISERTYTTLKRLERPSSKVFDNRGAHLRSVIARVPGVTFRFHDYRRCYQLQVMWTEIIIPASSTK